MGVDKMETFRYERTITINDLSLIREMTNRLLDLMENDAKMKKENIEYFQLRLKDPEKGMSPRDLKLEWMTSRQR